MDVDFWAARVHRNNPSVQSSRLGNSGNHLVMEEEGSEDVCPICAANLGKDAIGHFVVQHAHSIKRRRKSQKSGFWSNASSNIMKDLRELGGNSVNGSEPATDPLVMPLLRTRPPSVPKDSQQAISLCVAGTSDAESKSSCLDEAEAHNHEEMKQRVAFVHDLLISTIF